MTAVEAARAVRPVRGVLPGFAALYPGYVMSDTGERRLLTFLFEDMVEGSDDEWLASLDAK